MRRCATSSALSGLSAWMSENDVCITYEKGIEVTKAEIACVNEPWVLGQGDRI